jgi:opacity protein-like surface antigen
MRTMITALVSGALLLCASLAAAEGPPDDRFSREGGYLGLGSLFSFEIFQESDLQSQNSVLHANVHQPGYGLNLRGGWRHSPHLATELLLDVIVDRDYTINGNDSETREIAGSFNVKVPFMTQRVQPYAAAGLGVLYTKIANTTTNDSVRFMLRGALGLDVYVTEHWVINTEAVYMYPTGKAHVDLNSGKVRLDTVSVGAGFAYRF